MVEELWDMDIRRRFDGEEPEGEGEGKGEILTRSGAVLRFRRLLRTLGIETDTACELMMFAVTHQEWMLYDGMDFSLVCIDFAFLQFKSRMEDALSTSRRVPKQVPRTQGHDYPCVPD